MRHVLWAGDALRDLDQIDDWYAERDPDFADRVGDRVLNAAGFLIKFPFAGPVYYGKVRKWPVPNTDYRLLYRVTDTAVEIVRVRHAREDVEKIF
jgi:toxin ParE1/3/4